MLANIASARIQFSHADGKMMISELRDDDNNIRYGGWTGQFEDVGIENEEKEEDQIALENQQLFFFKMDISNQAEKFLKELLALEENKEEQNANSGVLLYLSRLVLPFWLQPIIDKSETEFLKLAVSRQSLMQTMPHLSRFKAFLERVFYSKQNFLFPLIEKIICDLKIFIIISDDRNKSRKPSAEILSALQELNSFSKFNSQINSYLKINIIRFYDISLGDLGDGLASDEVVYLKGFDLLADAKSSSNFEDQFNLVHEAAKLFKQLAGKRELKEAISEFLSNEIQSYDSAIELTLAIADAETAEQKSARVSSAHSITRIRGGFKSDMIENVIQILEKMICKLGTEALLVDEQLQQIFRKIEKISNNEELHTAVLNWILTHELKPLLFSFDSIYCEAYLFNQRKYAHLAEYYEYHHQFSKLAELEEELFKDRSRNFYDRLNHLARAKNFASVAEGFDSNRLQEFADLIDVAEIQISLNKALKQSGINAQDQKILSEDFLSAKQLLNISKKKFQFEITLMILDCVDDSDPRIFKEIDNAWIKLIKREFERSQNPLQTLKKRILELANKFRRIFNPTLVFFTLFDQLHHYSKKRGQRLDSKDHFEWISSLMLSAGLNHRQLFEIYHQQFRVS